VSLVRVAGARWARLTWTAWPAPQIPYP